MQFAKQIPITKVDDELRIVWGWAYVNEEGGEQVVDVSETAISSGDMQKAAHGFVSNYRVGGAVHKHRVGRVVDSIYFSKAVQDALGIDLGRVGWFIGFEVLDDAAWSGVKDGTYKAFSIGGEADEEQVDAAA